MLIWNVDSTQEELMGGDYPRGNTLAHSFPVYLAFLTPTSFPKEHPLISGEPLKPHIRPYSLETWTQNCALEPMAVHSM